MTSTSPKPPCKCRRCDEPFADEGQDSPPWRIYRCRVCSYINVLSEKAAVVPLSEALATAGLNGLRSELVDTEDSGLALDVMQQSIRALTSHTIRSLGDDFELLHAAILISLSLHDRASSQQEERRGDAQLERSTSGRALALLYLFACKGGTISLDGARNAMARPDFRAYWERINGPLHDAAALGSYVRACLQRDNVPAIRDGEMVLSVTRQKLDAMEWVRNEPSTKRLGDSDRPWIEILDEALELFDKVGPLRMLACTSRGEPPRRVLAPEEIGGGVWLRSDAFDAAERQVLQRHALTWDRVATSETPWYFDLAPRRMTAASDDEIALSLAKHNWLAYYPLLPMTWHGSDGYLTLDSLIVVWLNNLVASKSRLMEEAWTRRNASTVRPDAQRRLGQLRRSLNRHLEKQAAEVLEAAGWSTRVAVTLRAPPTSAQADREEVDVLAVSPEDASHPLLLVIEVKDYDFRLGSTFGPSNMYRRASAAQRQALRKAVFVRRNLGQVREALDFDSRCTVLPLIVTRDALPLGMFEEVHALALCELPWLLVRCSEDRTVALRILSKEGGAHLQQG